MKRMLINATQQEELRMAMVDGQRLYDLNIDLPSGERKKANIYKGKITRIEPSLEAAFVDFGAERHGFLPLKEISSEYFVKSVDSGAKPNIREVLKEGQDIVVQIDKEERGNKGAALTTFVSLAGRFIVLKPNKARSGGVSRRIIGSDRDLARKSLDEVQVPDGMSVILRTAGIDRSAEELAWDLENLLMVWTAILNVVLERKSPFLIYRESNAIVRALRDYLATDVGEILIDDEQTYKEASEFVEQVMPHNLRKLKLYTDKVPLFTRFQIETQIESAFAHSVDLPSGGSIVIDHTEALVSIDINSARATKGGDIEATALNTNLEAADEIARQLRIRDLGGLIVIDFIDMGPQKHQRDVENRLRDAVRQDRARVQIGKISRFGLLEMSRQRLRPSLGESSYLTCPRCSGIGTIRSVESLALAILRIIGEEARKERTAKVIAQLPVEVATFLLNEKRDWVRSVESHHDMPLVPAANPALETPHYEVRRVRDDQTELPENSGASYELAEAAAEPESPQAILARKQIEPAAIAVLKPSTPAPKPKKERKGLIAAIAALFGGDGSETKKKPVKPQARRRKSSTDDSRSRTGQRGKRRSEPRGGEDKQAAGKSHAKKNTKKKAANKQPPRTDDGTPRAAQADSAKPSRNRRSRGGRRRKRGSERPPQDQTAEANTGKPADTASTSGKSGGDKPQQPAASQAVEPRREALPVVVEATLAAAPQAETGGPPKARADAEAGGPPKARTDAEAGGSPKARTDSERAADAARQRDDSRPDKPVPAAPDESKNVQENKSEKQNVTKDTSGNGSRDVPGPAAAEPPPPPPEKKPDGRLLPWDD